MMTPGLACDHELLRQSLSDELSERQEETLARHLSECESCQKELERLAAEQADWSRVAEVLRQEAVSRLSSAGADETHIPACDSAVDFAVAFLEPSGMAGALGRLGDIDILEVIGHGGMGVVLKGFQQELHRPVAVKVLAPHLASSGVARQRFAREAQATAVVVHPNVMPVLTVNSSGKLPYLVMPYVPCESLQQRLDRQGALASLEVVRIALQVSRGLAAAHAQGLVHRDVKPANMLLEKGVERVMLTDFGLARAADDASLTRTGMITGTPQYMSPEQARGEATDASSDLFSLGSVMYAMCTGRAPFRAETSYGILRRITDTEPRPIRQLNPDIPDWLVAIIVKLHAKAPAERFRSADELAGLLEECLAHVQQPTFIPLPESLAALVPRAGEQARPQEEWTGEVAASAAQRPSAFPSQLGRGGKRLRRLPLLAAISAGAIVLTTVLGIAVRLHQDGRQRSETPEGTARSAEASPSANERLQPASPSARFDGTVGQIREMPAERLDKALPARWAFDFRGGKFDCGQLVPVGSVTLYDWALFDPEPRGLRITIPAHQGRERPTLGVAPAFTIHGDFQLTAGCELVTADSPTTSAPVGGQISIATQTSYNAASLLRGVTAQGRHVYALFWAVGDQTTGRMPVLRPVPGDSRTTRLRFVRTGAILHLQAAEEESTQFRELAQVEFGREPVGVFQVESVTNGAPCTAETRWSCMEIRAEELQPVVIPLYATGRNASPCASQVDSNRR